MTSSSWYRRSVFGMKGNREYTKLGFEHASLKFGEKDLDVDCSDRHFMITGGNSGIGLATALEIAKRGGILHLVCRNATSMKEARSHIITTTGNDRIYQHQLNLAKPAEVAKWAKEFTETHGHLDVLIHNAGLLINEREVDEDNSETMFAVHSLAVHLITLILLPVLRRSKDPRVIIVSSAGMLTVRLDSSDLNFEKMNPFDGRLAYSQTKRQQVIMNFSYAQRYDKVKFFSMHPGWVDTPGIKRGLPEFYEQMKYKLRTPEQGADTIIWLAISEAALKHSSGLFFQDRVPTATHLPLAWTRTSTVDEQHFMTILDKLFVKYSSLDPEEIPQSSVHPGHPDRVEMNSENQSFLHHPSEDEPKGNERLPPVANVSKEVEGTIEEAALIINKENLNRENTPEGSKTECNEVKIENEFSENGVNHQNTFSKDEPKENKGFPPVANVCNEVEGTIKEAAVIINDENLNRNVQEADKTECSEVKNENEATENGAYHQNSSQLLEKEKIDNENSLNESSSNNITSSVFDNSREDPNQKVDQIEEAENADSSTKNIPNNEVLNNSSEHANGGENISEHNETNKISATVIPELTTTLVENHENNIHNSKSPESPNVETVANEG